MAHRAAQVGERRIDNFYGYVWEKVANHPAFRDGWVKVHHLVWWRYRKQRVPRGYVLHHKDHNKENNKVGNLQLMTRSEHATLHGKLHVHTEETKAKMKVSSKARCTPEWREAVSKRVKEQHAAGKFGAATVSAEGRKRATEKISAKLKGRPGNSLGRRATEEQREHYHKAAVLREAKKREEGFVVSVETREKMSASLKGQKRSPDSCERIRQAAVKREAAKRRK